MGGGPNLSQFAHPRNPYRNGLGDLDALAANDPAFGRIAKRHSETNRVRCDWSDRDYVRQLMMAVIRRDFRVDLLAPEKSLAPALTNKMNYLLWIEDVLKANKLLAANRPVHGLDIGTGASMYFAVMAVQKFDWKMTATESSKDDYEVAVGNMKRNPDLNGKISLIFNQTPAKIFPLQAEQEFVFSMCNPPFYANESELPERSEYKGEDAGRHHELCTDGGELEFVSRMIQESREMVEGKIKIFTTIVGHKKNVPLLKHKLADFAKHVSVTELCQGRTMRWGLAWTLDPNLTLNVASLKAEVKAKEKLKAPIIYVIPGARLNCTDVHKLCTEWFAEIHVEVAKQGAKLTEDYAYMRLKTNQTEWRGQRAKRRAEKAILEQGPPAKKQKGSSQQEDMEVDDTLKLDCQLFMHRVDSKVSLEFIYMDGELGKNGLCEIVQFVKNKLQPIVKQ